MEKGSEQLIRKTDKAFHELYDKIFSYLDFPSLMQALCASQDFFHLLNKYFKNFLKTNNLITETGFEVEEDHYLKLFRAFYAREILAAPLSSIKSSYSELKLTRYPKCSSYGIKDFSIGMKFTVLHLFNNDLIFFKNEEYLDPHFHISTISVKNTRKNVAKFSTASNDLFYLTSSGHLNVVFNTANRPSDEFSEATLAITVDKPLADFDLSYPRAILLFKGTASHNQAKQLASNEEQKEDKNAQQDGVYQDIRCFDMVNLVPEDLNSPARIRKVEGLDNQQVVSLCVGASHAYFLTDKNNVYECDFSALNNDKYRISLFEPFKNKIIRKLWAGKGFYFALEQKEIQSIETWTASDILEWAETKPFYKHVNAKRLENVSGHDLLTADKDYLEFRFGISDDEDMLVKFLNEIEKVSKITYTDPRLFGWGNNSAGQLGLNTGQGNVISPSEIKTLPEFGKDDFIEHLECGAKATAIVTHKGKVWITEIPPKKEAKGKNVTRWLDLSPLCQTLKDGRQYKVVKVSLGRDYFAVLAANVGVKKATKKKGEDQKKSLVKFKGADHICDRLLWDESLKKEEYVVGYEDRFLGVLEIPFTEFCMKKDIPTHRVQYFKRKGELVWDRASKMNNIGV